MVKKIKITIVFIIMLTLSASCQKDKYPVDMSGLIYRNKLVYNNQFRIDGFYYGKIDTSQNYINVDICYFFSDGTYCIFDIEASKLLDLPNNDFIDIPNKIRQIPYCWGAYIIEDGIVKIQVFNSYRDSFEKFKVEENWAKITNDKTLHVFKYISPKREERISDITFYFKKCLSKPDSINILMKY